MLYDYNGWSGLSREKADKRFRDAVRAGQIKWPPCDACEMCGAPGAILHAEEYGPTLKDYIASMRPVCDYCHGMLHTRFRYPGKWAQFVARLESGEPAPHVPGIWKVFIELGNTPDVPVVPITQNPDKWWTLISVGRYTGKMKELA